jgi:opacity protein-like surface antigen
MGFYKIKIRFIFILSFLAITVKAQSNYEYGIRGSLNLSTIGTQYGKYNGSGYYNIGVFGSKKISDQILLAFEPTYSLSGFKEKQNDSRYTLQHLDLNLNAYFSMFGDDALWLYLGLRPGYLLGSRSETIKDGNYVKLDAVNNTNKIGKIDIGLNAGFSVKLSPVVNFELGYHYSATNNNDNVQIQGRTSTIEMTLKLNAVDLKRLIDKKEITLKEQIQEYQKGVLFVMLPSLSEKDLARLSDEGDRNYTINELRVRNLKVVAEFIRNYSFTPVYFFADSNINQIISGNYSSIFLNKNLEVDTTIKVHQKMNFMVASFCNDLYNYSDRISYGLFIYDNKMNQMGKPYTIPGQMFGLYTDGDPQNYFKTKRINYTNMPFDRMIRKFNSRMIRYAEF